MEPEDVAKVIALKAYRVGRDAVAEETEDTHRALAMQALARLEEANQTTDEQMLRRIFYALVLAELERDAGTTAYRKQAVAWGRTLEDPDADPYPYYMQVVDKTTTAPRARDWGVMQQHRILSPSSVIDDVLATQLGMSRRVLRMNRRFLYELDLASIVRKHGLS